MARKSVHCTYVTLENVTHVVTFDGNQELSTA